MDTDQRESQIHYFSNVLLFLEIIIFSYIFIVYIIFWHVKRFSIATSEQVIIDSTDRKFRLL